MRNVKYIDSFTRDSSNPGAVVNTDSNALKAYKIQKAKAKEQEDQKKEIMKLKESINELSSLKGEMKEIKQVLQRIAENLNGN